MDPVLLVCLLAIEAVCFGAMVHQAAEVPVGYEDDRGFHFGDDPLWSSDSEF